MSLTSDQLNQPAIIVHFNDGSRVKCHNSPGIRNLIDVYGDPHLVSNKYSDSIVCEWIFPPIKRGIQFSFGYLKGRKVSKVTKDIS